MAQCWPPWEAGGSRDLDRPAVEAPPYRVTVPVKVSRPSPTFDSSTALIRPPPLSPSKRPRPFTTFQSLRCFTPGGVEVKVIVRVPPGQRNDLTTNRCGGSTGPSMNFPPAQRAESPMVDPARTSPVVSPLALRGATCVLIRIGSPLSLALAPGSSPPAVVPASDSTAGFAATLAQASLRCSAVTIGTNALTRKQRSRRGRLD
jgi:hypothetical protein